MLVVPHPCRSNQKEISLGRSVGGPVTGGEALAGGDPPGADTVVGVDGEDQTICLEQQVDLGFAAVPCRLVCVTWKR